MASNHVVVDGSNIATEGRAAPSLQQLDEAVRALLAEYGYEHVTVVVDATFGHRIDAKEVSAYEEAVLNGELVTPPAGAIGRGDAFVLQIADRANADVFSNDSFQEFHGEYPWLFDEGRLIGGKPVANVGWVFVLRAPVRGPASRRAVRDSRKSTKSSKTPLRTPKTPGRKAAEVSQAPTTAATKATKAGKTTKTATPAKAAKKASLAAPLPLDEPSPPPARSRRRRSAGRHEPINDQVVYLTFVVDHPVGSVVEGTVDRFASHGAYVHAGDAQCYVPLRELGDPPPRSAREVLNVGETRPFVVHRFDPVRRGIDVLPVAGTVAVAESGRDVAEAVAAEATGSTNQTTHAEEAHVSPAAKKGAARKRAATKKAPARKKKAAAKRAPARRKSAARKTTARKSTARKSTAKKATRKKVTGRKKAAKKRTAARKTTAKKATRKRAASRARKR
jgi:S1 RNA binding domain/Zc3h12a-like Ribonuclease NYN domain